MNQPSEKHLLVTDTLPAFAVALRQLLKEHCEPELADKMAGFILSPMADPLASPNAVYAFRRY